MRGGEDEVLPLSEDQAGVSPAPTPRVVVILTDFEQIRWLYVPNL